MSAGAGFEGMMMSVGVDSGVEGSSETATATERDMMRMAEDPGIQSPTAR